MAGVEPSLERGSAPTKSLGIREFELAPNWLLEVFSDRQALAQ
jgi:hypothetical protein